MAVPQATLGLALPTSLSLTHTHSDPSPLPPPSLSLSPAGEANTDPRRIPANNAGGVGRSMQRIRGGGGWSAPRHRGWCCHAVLLCFIRTDVDVTVVLLNRGGEPEVGNDSA